VSDPLVTVVIPAYNAERWIEACVASALNQTWPSIECLVVDDGSTDETATIAGSFGEKVGVVSVSNGGVARARNIGLNAASGEYIAFLDADDQWHPEKIERQMSVFDSNPALGLVYTSLALIDEDGHSLGVLEAPEPSEARRKTLLMEPPPVGLCQSAVVPAKVLATVGEFDQRLTTSADADLFCRIAAAYPVGVVREPLALYRLHTGQMHEDLSALEHDMRIILSEHLGGNSLARRRLRGQAKAGLYVTLAIASASRGHWTAALRHGIRAARANPLRTLVLGGQGWRHRLRPSPRRTA
jgi:glycosyltransferase involved in cell wall biosynthesis